MKKNCKKLKQKYNKENKNSFIYFKIFNEEQLIDSAKKFGKKKKKKKQDHVE